VEYKENLHWINNFYIIPVGQTEKAALLIDPNNNVMV